jgi:hypothetical protein
MIELTGRVAGVIKAVEGRLPRSFPEAVWAPLSKGLIEQAKSFLSHAFELV